MATGATGANCHVDVKLGWRPGRVTLVAGRAVGGCADVINRLTRCIGAVVATCASGCTGKGTVIRLGAGPDRRGFVAALAICCRGHMVARLATGDGSVMAA